MNSSKWDLINSKIEYENQYFEVVRDSIQLPSGDSNTYYRVGFGDSVIALGVINSNVIFVKLYRPRLDQTLLELPGGKIDADETPVEAAKREFREETGYQVSGSELLGSFYYSAWTRAKRHIVWLDGLSPGDPEHEDPEIKEVCHVPLSEVVQTVTTGPAGEWNLTPIFLAQQRDLIEL